MDDQNPIEELFDSVSLGAPENAVGFVLWRVVHRYQREIDRALAPLDLTHLQFTTLAMAAWLGKSGQAATQSGIAQAGEIHPMQVSHMVKSLESKGMVTRIPSTSDVRAKLIQISAQGIKALRDAIPLAIEVQRRMFGATGDVGGDLLVALRAIEGQHRQ